MTDTPLKKIRLVIVSGLSGAGKSTALNVLEDIGFFCVGNLPITLLPRFLELCHLSSGDITKVAVVIDIRERVFLKDFSSIFKGLKREGYRTDLVFLESTDEVLIRRFRETRRLHPLAIGDSPVHGIELERMELSRIKEMADKTIDTSGFTIHELKETLR